MSELVYICEGFADVLLPQYALIASVFLQFQQHIILIHFGQSPDLLYEFPVADVTIHAKSFEHQTQFPENL
jgi:hypothetical protein